MEISAEQVVDILRAKGIQTIYHANTVATACQFLRSGALLSRGTIERRKLYQTPQSSDRIDKEYGIWFDVFADSDDIHNRARRMNIYGPVLFVLDVDLIKHAHTGNVWVTKLNPTEWAGKKYEERWFTSASELESNLIKGRFEQMIVFRHCGGELHLGDYLQNIILDDPQRATLNGKVDLYSMAYGALTLAAMEGSLATKIARRNCRAGCTCIGEYQKDSTGTLAKFFPTARTSVSGR